MLITRSIRDQRAQIGAHLPGFRAWLEDHTWVDPQVRADADAFAAGWSAVDRGVASDPALVRSSFIRFSNLLERAKDQMRAPASPAKWAGGPGHMEPADQLHPVPLSWLPDWLNPFAPSAEAERAVSDTADAWAQIAPKMYANEKLRAQLKDIYQAWLVFYSNWQAGLKDVSRVNAEVESVNVARRIVGNFDQSNDPAPVHGVDVEQASPALAAGAAAEAYCKDHPDAWICVVSDPKSDTGPSWCQLAGLPAAVCDKNGLKDWFLWTLGIAGVTVTAGAIYVGYKGVQAAAPYALPMALALTAPELMPAMSAAQGGARPGYPGGPGTSTTAVSVYPGTAYQGAAYGGGAYDAPAVDAKTARMMRMAEFYGARNRR
jgi:hypothetical protein